MFILFNDQFCQKIDQKGKQNNRKYIDQLKHISHRDIQLSGNLGQVVLCDRGSNVCFFDIGDLFV